MEEPEAEKGFLKKRQIDSTDSRRLEQAAVMSRRRFICFQSVTLLTALITCFTMFGVSLLKNEELQSRLLNWGRTATCLLNASATDHSLIPQDPEPADWTKFFNFLLRLSHTCHSHNQSASYFFN